MRKMLREHDAGTKRIQEMTERRSKLMFFIQNKMFRNLNTELRQQEHQVGGGATGTGGTSASSPTHQTQKIAVGATKH